jgi:hypothetical protein
MTSLLDGAGLASRLIILLQRYSLPLLMHLLAENQDVLRLMASSATLLNSIMEGFAIRYESDGLVAEVVFRLQRSEQVKGLLLRFKPVTAYKFAFSQEAAFYHVESFKFLQVANGYYLSLDPFDESYQADERDNDTIRAEGVQAYQLTEPERN